MPTTKCWTHCGPGTGEGLEKCYWNQAWEVFFSSSGATCCASTLLAARLRLTLADEEAGRQEDTLTALRDAGRLTE